MKDSRNSFIAGAIRSARQWMMPLPFLAICAARAVVANWREARRLILALLLVWDFGSTVAAYPNYLA